MDSFVDSPIVAAVAVLLPLALSVAIGGPLIRVLRKLRAGQRVRDDGPQRHLDKEGTPTMGGIMIVGAAILSTLVITAAVADAPFLWRGLELLLEAMIVPMLGFGAIGFADDWLKIRHGRSLGLKARQKVALQFVVAVPFVVLAGFMTDDGRSDPTTSVATVVVWSVLMVATANAVNLADGLDGLAAGLCVIGIGGFTCTLVLSGMALGDTVFFLTVAGACLGFLWFNRHPARLFMGDVGSLALGGVLATMGIYTQSPAALLGFCLVPFLEAASVVIQVISFKTTGKRVFRMSPIHHHFELSGWSEQQVVTRFWLVALLAAAATITLGLDRWQWW